MSRDDQQHWDERYTKLGPAPAAGHAPPAVLAAVEDRFTRAGTALDVACGQGRTAVWLAKRGMSVHGIDVSPVAINLAHELARQAGVSDRSRFDVHDLDGGLPPGEAVDLVLCHLYREADLDGAMIRRLKPGGTLAIACLSEVGHGPGRFRAPPGELANAFRELNCLESGEADGYAWFVGSNPDRSRPGA